MKFEIFGKEFKSVINRMSGVVPKKSTVFTTENIKIIAHKNYVEFQSTDYDSFSSIKIYTRVYEQGETWLHLPEVKKISNIPDDIMMVISENDVFEIRSAKKSYEISCNELSESWITFPVIDSNPLCVCEDVELLENLSRLDCFRAKDCPNSLLTSFYFDFPKHMMVAIDGRRIATAKLSGKYANQDNCFGVIADGSLYARLKSLMVKRRLSRTDIKVYADDTYIYFEGLDWTYTSKVMHGKYYDYEKMIEPAKSNYDFMLKVNSEELKNIAKEYNTVSSKKIMLFCFSGGKLATGVEDDKYKTSDIIDEFDVEFANSGEWYAGYNPKFILDACSLFDKDIIIVGKYNSKNPIMFLGTSYEVLILPCLITENDIEYVRRQINS